MNNSLWKFLAIASATTHTIVLLTFISRLYPDVAFIVFVLTVIALICLIMFYPDIQSEDWWIKGVLLGLSVLGFLVGMWDFILDYLTYLSTQKELSQDWLYMGGVVFILGVVYVCGRSQDSKNSR